MPNGSKSGEVSWLDIKKVLVGALLAGAGAAVAMLIQAVANTDLTFKGFDFGPLLGAALAVLANFIRKLSTDTRTFLLVLALCLGLSGACYAAPPKIDIPAETKASGDYVTIIPETDAKAVSYVAQSGVEPFPAEFLKDPRVFILAVRGLPEGRYLFVAVGSLKDEHARASFAIVVGNDPPPVPPGPKPPVPPGPPPTIPPDRFDNIGQSGYQWGKELGLSSAVARGIANDYKAVSAQLAAGGLPGIAAANVELRKRREASIPQAERAKWDTWGQRVGGVWNKHNVAPKDEQQYHAGVIEFYNAVAAGLGVL